MNQVSDTELQAGAKRLAFDDAEPRQQDEGGVEQSAR